MRLSKRLQASGFKRQLEEGHMTASAWLISADGKRVLLTHHRKLNLWLQPGGHCEGDADIRRVALKEAQEESGIDQWDFVSEEIFDIDIHEIPAHRQEPAHYHYDVRFLLQAVGNEDYVVSEESHDLAWVELEKLSAYTDEESILRMARKWFLK